MISERVLLGREPHARRAEDRRASCVRDAMASVKLVCEQAASVQLYSTLNVQELRSSVYIRHKLCGTRSLQLPIDGILLRLCKELVSL